MLFTWLLAMLNWTQCSICGASPRQVHNQAASLLGGTGVRKRWTAMLKALAACRSACSSEHHTKYQ